VTELISPPDTAPVRAAPAAANSSYDSVTHRGEFDSVSDSRERFDERMT